MTCDPSNRARKSVQKLAILGGAALTSPAYAVEEFNVAPGLTYAGAPLGLHGVDPVALVNDGTQVEGDAVYLAAYDGVAYYFADAANQATFEGRCCIDPAWFDSEAFRSH